MTRPTVPHHGPVRADCPLECLLTGPLSLSLMSYNRLRWNSHPPPGTVGDLVSLYRRDELRGIRGLGPKRVTEIAAALVLNGFDLAAHAGIAQTGST
jgi:hypothetical protein